MAGSTATAVTVTICILICLGAAFSWLSQRLERRTRRKILGRTLGDYLHERRGLEAAEPRIGFQRGLGPSSSGNLSMSHFPDVPTHGLVGTNGRRKTRIVSMPNGPTLTDEINKEVESAYVEGRNIGCQCPIVEIRENRP